jgi:hypothetical protein
MSSESRSRGKREGTRTWWWAQSKTHRFSFYAVLEMQGLQHAGWRSITEPHSSHNPAFFLLHSAPSDQSLNTESS